MPATIDDLNEMLSEEYNKGYSEGFNDGRAKQAEDVANLPQLVLTKGPVYDASNKFIGFYSTTGKDASVPTFYPASADNG